MNNKISNNPFLTAIQSHDIYTENGAVSHSTTGNALLDYFSKAGTYRDRDIKNVHADVSKMWAESPLMTLQMLFYMRLVTRNPKGFFTSDEVAKGQGIRDEYRKAIHWVAKYQPDFFYKNIWLMPVVGCWKDLWHEDLIDVLDQDKVFELIERGMADKYNRALLAKFVPKLRSKRNTHNQRHIRLNAFAHALRVRLNMSEKDYRKFKSSGEAHTFQRAMSGNLWNQLDFKRIPGKALFQLVNHKGRDGKTTLERHALEDKFVTWLQTQPVAKFTGYPYELFKAATHGLSLAQKTTLDKQFSGLVELAKKGTGGIKGNVWCALDTSGSMTCLIPGSDVTAYDVCAGLGIYFAELNQGAFHNHVIMFADTSKALELKGSFVDRAMQIRQSCAMGSTNFQSVIDEIVRIRKTRPDIPVDNYPTTLLVVSDMQFNPTNTWTTSAPTQQQQQTNHEAAMSKLRAVGLPDMQIIWWQVNGQRTKDFVAKENDNGTVMISGFDGAIITNILGGNQTVKDEVTGEIRRLNPMENMVKALTQPILSQVKI